MLDLSRLGPEQRRAVLAPDGPALIVAGPGSGKTTVLAARIAFLVLSRRVPPTSILALTFATKAARELRTRLHGLLGEPGLSVDVTTFHAFGLRIVRQWSEELGFGIDPPTVYGEGDARSLLLEAAGRQGVTVDDRPIATWMADVTRLRLAVDHVVTDEPLGRLAREYEELLRRRCAIDYPAMLSLPLRLFGEHPAALRLCQDAYRHVLVDEFQDVCGAQYELLRWLAERHRNLVAVGDPRQALYGWRGADVRNLHRLLDDFPGAQLFSLDQNYRSTERIVGLANLLAERLGSYSPLWTDNPPGVSAVLYVAGDERQEAAYVADEITRLESAGAIGSLADVAVLFRTNWQAEELIVAFRERRLPYWVRGGGDLFTRREVRDAIAYLRLTVNPGDVAALARVANVPPRALGRLAELLRESPCTTDALPARARLYGAASFESATKLRDLIGSLREQAFHLSPARLLDVMLDRTGYRAWVASRPDGPSRLRRLTDLRRLAERAGGSLADWLVELQLGEEATSPADGVDRVLLTTIHRAKGGEWSIVFVVGVEEGLLPHARATAGISEMGVEPIDQAGLDEELRVAYVAVTRPRERLYLTYCRQRRRGERIEPRASSRFLRGLPAELLARAA